MLLSWYREIKKGNVVWPSELALIGPRTVSDVDNSTIVMFLDEFQNSRTPHLKYDLLGFMQQAVEALTCPHFVTGSAMSMLGREILGRGSLFGRFSAQTINPMTEYWGAELALKAARYHNAQVSELMAPVVAERCGGNPFYITAVVKQAAAQNKALSDEDTLNEVLAVDVSGGFIWGELSDQVNRWIERINEHKITKWILYLSALEEGDRLDLNRIQRELKEREGKEVSLDLIRDTLIKLSRGDLVEYLEFGEWFRKVKDPILIEFLKVWGKIEIEGYSVIQVKNELVSRYGQLKRRFSEYQGYVAEVFMSQVLWNGQRKTIPGSFFHSPEDIQMPHPFFYVEHRVRTGSGKEHEIDIVGAAGHEQWVCESKWVMGRKAGKAEVEELIEKAEKLKRDGGYRLVRMWLFSHDGLTEEAQELAAQRGVLWSSRAELDQLLAYLELRQLPDV
ncbi:MAG TPA: hypothetical protein VJL89_11535 [Thermodesulfovibrionia bacterium]|nr:hypothetical protein [Thermodesulfovibrionia bacterium]